jgi:hypothetical protein
MVPVTPVSAHDVLDAVSGRAGASGEPALASAWIGVGRRVRSSVLLARSATGAQVRFGTMTKTGTTRWGTPVLVGPDVLRVTAFVPLGQFARVRPSAPSAWPGLRRRMIGLSA